MDDDEFVPSLHSAPSFEIYNTSSHGVHDETYTTEDLDLKIRESFGEFTFGSKKRMIEEAENDERDSSYVPSRIQNLRIEEEKEEQEEDDDDVVVDLEPPSPPMYLAAGLGVDSALAGYEFDSFVRDELFNPNMEESEDLEGYYKRMLDEYPCHPLILKNYAKLLQDKEEFEGAEDYFYRATLTDPNDGEALMEYAKLLWEQHHDKDKALVYFDRAVQAAPADSYVLAAYTSFLWETEDETENEKEKQDTEPVKPANEESKAVNLTTANWSEDSNVADYLKKMIDENPNNPLFLKKYAQFLFQSKDLEEAEDYYSRAVLADPSDGETISDYAKLVWELHRDQEKASSLFEQAVQATPGDSNVLAAYTCFLWETEDGES